MKVVLNILAELNLSMHLIMAEELEKYLRTEGDNFNDDGGQ
jgi:hypothetical protein